MSPERGEGQNSSQPSLRAAPGIRPPAENYPRVSCVITAIQLLLLCGDFYENERHKDTMAKIIDARREEKNNNIKSPVFFFLFGPGEKTPT